MTQTTREAGSQHEGGTATSPPSHPTIQTNAGPEALKQKVRVVVDTKPASGLVATNAARVTEKALQWRFSWEGWDGLYVGITERTPMPWRTAIRHLDPRLTNALARVHLEESKMEGHIGARVAVDAAGFTTTGDLGGFDGGVQLRRLRLCAQGDCILVLPVSYELEVGYVPGGFYIEDSYLAFQNLGLLGELKFGQFQTPMSLAAVTSSRDITFMEEAAPVQALAPGVNAGVQLGRSVFRERSTWALGLFGEGLGEDTGDASSDYARAIGRITWLPWYDMNGGGSPSQQLLHLGLSGNILYSASSNVRYKSRPESHIAPIVIDTGAIDASGAAVFDIEAAWVRGPLSIQGEFLNSFVDQTGGSPLYFHGAYGSVSWFLTGESRPYDRRKGAFARLKPSENASLKGGGLGAWEVSGRVSHTDLNDRDIAGGRLTLFSGGLNWYPHPHVRWQFNYVHGLADGWVSSGAMNIFETRLQFDF
ncbi:MAG: hypothetical protein KDM81_08430 [Verrucomicrobiae bacterium]|nr:hypothetical protein [Verrucomicrobiae bacterium]MCP5523306.1 hypothetical protein [Verrucomicrobiales bacterium]